MYPGYLLLGPPAPMPFKIPTPIAWSTQGRMPRRAVATDWAGSHQTLGIRCIRETSARRLYGTSLPPSSDETPVAPSCARKWVLFWRVSRPTGFWDNRSVKDVQYGAHGQARRSRFGVPAKGPILGAQNLPHFGFVRPNRKLTARFPQQRRRRCLCGFRELGPLLAQERRARSC